MVDVIWVEAFTFRRGGSVAARPIERAVLLATSAVMPAVFAGEAPGIAGLAAHSTAGYSLLPS